MRRHREVRSSARGKHGKQNISAGAGTGTERVISVSSVGTLGRSASLPFLFTSASPKASNTDSSLGRPRAMALDAAADATIASRFGRVRGLESGSIGVYSNVETSDTTMMLIFNTISKSLIKLKVNRSSKGSPRRHKPS